jgi:hypothetical protein
MDTNSNREDPFISPERAAGVANRYGNGNKRVYSYAVARGVHGRSSDGHEYSLLYCTPLSSPGYSGSGADDADLERDTDEITNRDVPDHRSRHG